MADTWKVIGSKEYGAWYRGLSEQEQDAIIGVLNHLRVEGPSLRRPISGQISGSTFKNMKELIPPKANIRILYIFDPIRNAILLLGGDKTNNWTKWYDTNIPIAEVLFQRHLGTSQANATPPQPPAKAPGTPRRKKS